MALVGMAYGSRARRSSFSTAPLGRLSTSCNSASLLIMRPKPPERGISGKRRTTSLSNSRKDLADARTRVEALTGRVDTLDDERDAHKAAIRALTAYTRQLKRMLRAAGITPPEPPGGCNEHTLP
jgi:hypothetical protein